MKKKHLTSVLLIALSFTLSSFANARSFFDFNSINNTWGLYNNSLDKLYEELNLADYGMDRNALDYALVGYDNLLDQGLVKNNQYLTVVDFSQPSHNKRFYILDLENRELITNTYVAHGKNSGGEMAERFSNTIDSYQSSLGFYLTKGTYTGSRGFSMRLWGLEKGFNNNAEKRNVVLHGSQFVNEARALNGTMGRSLGCLAVPQAENATIIDKLKHGSVIFIYYPSGEYLVKSPILNRTASPFLSSIGQSFFPQ